MPPTGDVAICLVGEARVMCGGQVVHPRIVGGPRCVEVFAYLAVHRHRDVAQDELARLMWPTHRPPSWQASLRGVLSRLRDAMVIATLPADSIRSRAGNVRLTLPVGMGTDLELVRSHSAGLGAELVASARAVLALLSGPVLPGCVGQWADDVRTECAVHRRRALEIDADGSLRIGDLTRALESADELLADDPLRESAYRTKIRAYVALGERGQALAEASRCRRTLVDELGIGPSAETEKLYLDILRDDARERPAPMAAPQHPVTSGPQEPRASVVGRVAELRAVADSLDRAGRGAGQFVVITGEAGTGKTTLVHEAMDAARVSGVDVLFGRCSEEAVISFEPFVEAIDTELDALGPDRSRQWLVDNGSDILRLIPNASRRFRDLMPASTETDDRAVIMTAVVDWLTSPTRDSATLLVIDDLHWASPATLAVLRYVIHASRRSRLCVVTTVRDEYVDRADIRSTLLAPTRSSGVHRIALGGFSIAEIGALVDASGTDLDPEVLLDRTDGLPLFVVSLINSHSTGTAGALPGSVAESVAHRESLLTADALDLLRLCSVVGMTAPRHLLRAAFATVDDIAFAEAVDGLVRHRLVIESDSGDDIHMRHPVVQEAVYAGIAGHRRSELHSRVAVALEQLGTTSGPDEFARIAHHFGRGLDSDRPLAAAYSWRAGGSATAVGAYEDAVVFYTRAADQLLPRGNSAERCRLLVDLGRAQRKARDPAFRATLLGAVEMARRLGDVDLQVTATLANDMQGILYVHVHSDPERIESLYDALDALGSAGRDDTAETAALLAQLAIELIWQSDHSTRHDLLTRALDIARAVGDRGVLVTVLSSIQVALRYPVYEEFRRAAFGELMGILDASRFRSMDPLMAVWIARAQVEFGEQSAAARTVGRLMPAQSSRDPELEWLVRNIYYAIDLAGGRLEQCEPQLDALRAIPASPTESYSFGRVLASVAALRTLRGDLQEIVDARDDLSVRFEILGVYRVILASAFADTGDHEAAADLVAWYDERRISEIACDHLWLITLTTLGRVAAQVDNRAVLRAVYDRLIDHADATVIVWAVVYGVVHHHLAHISVALGHLDRAERHLVDAIREHERRGFVGWRAESAYLAVWLDFERTGRVSEQLVDDARRRAETIGATAVLRRINSLHASLVS